MKIVQLLKGFPVVLSNEESEFVRRHSSSVKLTSLSEHDQITARNLVRRGIYDISKDNVTLINSTAESNS